MTRPDLGGEFDGWQASDPTPQEKSDGNTENKDIRRKKLLKQKSLKLS